MLALIIALLLLPTVVFAQGPGFFIAAPSTGRATCNAITSPITNQTWCADGNNNPNFTWKVWDGTQFVTITGGGGGATPGGPLTSIQFHDTGDVFGGNAGFIFDKTNVRVGLGSATPLAPLDIHSNPGTNAAAEVSGLKIDVSTTPNNPNPQSGDFVSLYSRMESTVARNRVWAANFVTDVPTDITAGGAAWGLEVDVNASFADAPPPFTFGHVIGIEAASGGSKAPSTAFATESTTSANRFQNGFWLEGIGGKTDSIGMYWGTSSLVKYGIFFADGSLSGSGGAISIPNNNALIWRDAAGTTDLPVLYVGPNNSTVIGMGSANVVSNTVGDLIVSDFTGDTAGRLTFYEQPSAHNPAAPHFVRFHAPASVATSYTCTLPPNFGTVGQVLQTDGANPCTLTWVNGGGTGTVTHTGTLTLHAPVVGNGGVDIKTIAALTDGQLAIGSTGADPVPATITAGTGITVTNGAGSITIASTVAGTVTHTGTLTANRFILGNGGADVIAANSITGLVLGNGASAPTAYAGSTPCGAGTFITALDASGVATCGAGNTGTGTTNTVTKFTNGASGIIGNSSITDNGTTVTVLGQLAITSSAITTGAGQTMVFTGATSGAATFKAPATVTTPYTCAWPVNPGNNGDFLTTDGANPCQMSWSAGSGASGITSLNGLSAAVQTVAAGSTNINWSSAVATHTFTWTGQLSAARGGTGQDTSAWSALPLVTAGTWSQYAGTTPCSVGSFITALSASGVATCTAGGTLTGSGANTQNAYWISATGLAGNSSWLFAPNLGLTVAPTGNLTATKASLSIQQTTINTATRQFMTNVGFIASQGTGDTVGLYVGLDKQGGTADVWSVNTVLAQEPATGSYNAQGYELDINNLNAHRGDADAGTGLSAPVTYGLTVTGASTFRSTAAIGVFGPGTAIWNRGIVFGNNAISTTGSTFQDLNAGHNKSIDIRGTPVWGIYQSAPASGTDNWLNGGVILGPVAAASLPAPGHQGRLIAVTDDNTLRMDNGAAWVTIGPSGGGGGGNVFAGGTLTAGQLVIGQGSTNVSALGTFGTTITVLHGNGAGAPTFGPVNLATDISGILGVTHGGTGLASGTSGGVPYFSSATTIASSGQLVNTHIVLGGGPFGPRTMPKLLDGQLPIGSTAGDPVNAFLTCSGGITCTPGSGSINIVGSGTTSTGIQTSTFAGLGPSTTIGSARYVTDTNLPHGLFFDSGPTPGGGSTTGQWYKVGTVVNVNEYGTRTRATIQAAINAAPAGSIVQLECGNYTLDGTTISIPKPLTLQGCGHGQTTLTATSPGGQTAISITSGVADESGASSVMVRDLKIVQSGVGSVGIVLTGGGGSPLCTPPTGLVNWDSNISSVMIEGGERGITVGDATGFVISNSTLHGQTSVGITVNKTICPDNGDALIIGNRLVGGGIGILVIAGGGIKVVGTSIAGFPYGVLIQPTGTINEFSFTGGKIGNFSQAGILLDTLTSGGNVYTTLITGNVIDDSGSIAAQGAIVLNSAPAALRIASIAITSNTLVLRGGGGHGLVGQGLIQQMTINSNNINGNGSTGGAIVLQAGATATDIGVNSIGGFTGTTPIVGGGARFSFTTPITFAQLVAGGLFGDGTTLYCSTCTIANPCAGGGSGAIMKQLAGIRVCN